MADEQRTGKAFVEHRAWAADKGLMPRAVRPVDGGELPACARSRSGLGEINF